VLFGAVTGRFAAVVEAAAGLAGGLAKLLPVVPRADEVDEDSLWAVEAVPAVRRDDVAALRRLGAAEVAGIAFFAAGAVATFFPAGEAVSSGLFGVSTLSAGASAGSGAMVDAGASGSAIVFVRGEGKRGSRASAQHEAGPGNGY